MNNTALELTLINALGKLKHLAVDNAFLNNKEVLAPNAVTEQYFAFYIGEYPFVISAQCFCAVFVETPIAAVPNSPAALVGLSNIRGALTPVYQLNTALGCAPAKKKFIFCVGKTDKAVGLLVDALPSSLALSANERTHSAPQNNNNLLRELSPRSYLHENRLWHWLDGEKIAEQLLLLANTE
jgi:chemotaxis signal transduction protein